MKGDVVPSATRTRRSAGRTPAQQMRRATLPTMQKTDLRRSVDLATFPKGRILTTNSPSPIVLAFDDTGSMGDWVIRMYEKLIMFYGQICIKNHLLPKPALSFCAFADSGFSWDGYSDNESGPLNLGNKYSFQVTGFARGDTLDSNIESIWLPSRYGGGNHVEDYAMVAYYYLNYCKLQAAQNPFFFMTGDEGYYPKINRGLVEAHFGSVKRGASLESVTVLRELAKKFECFMLRKKYTMESHRERGIHQSWVDAWGPQKILMLQEPKQIVDTMIGAIALKQGEWDLDQYARILEERKQTKTRIKNVVRTLKPYAEYVQRP
ncbi:MAG: hypothetical protein HQ564_09150 [Candidatus Saganbacteria bacterium]|nr:hypothetical protein [Candidatus Saganbacteria bacterium]